LIKNRKKYNYIFYKKRIQNPNQKLLVLFESGPITLDQGRGPSKKIVVLSYHARAQKLFV